MSQLTAGIPPDEWFGRARILVVEDDPGVVRVLANVLKSGGFGNVSAVSDVEAAIEWWTRAPPDLALVDLHLPGSSGFQLLEQVAPGPGDSGFLPVIMLTGDVSPAVRRRALNRGAHDFLTKPFDNVEVLLRVRNLLRTRLLNLTLEERVRERTRNLDEARLEALAHLARAAEFRDDVTGQHTHRVGALAAGIAGELGWDDAAVDLIRSAAPLHDIGKIGIPDAILMKRGRLTPEEFATMQRHTTIGAAILDGSRAPVFVLAHEIVLTHHERWDGTGYPRGLAGEAIPEAGRIVCVADVYDALVNERPYKPALPTAAALAELESNAGRHFDARAVAALKRFLTAAGPTVPPPAT